MYIKIIFVYVIPHFRIYKKKTWLNFADSFKKFGIICKNYPNLYIIRSQDWKKKWLLILC